MTTPGDAVPACSGNDMSNRIGTLPALAGPHAATGQELDLVAVAVAVGNGCAYLACRDFLTAAHNGVIVPHTEQLAGDMKKAFQERPDVKFITHPFPVLPGQTIEFTPVCQAECMRCLQGCQPTGMFCRAGAADSGTVTGNQNAIDTAVAPVIQLWPPALLALVPVMPASGSARQVGAGNDSEMNQQQRCLKGLLPALVAEAD